ncbi:hypothetical protein Hypma_002303 [Hypsizygus marmoreus]|uniref:Uncharacterized protein n=1 Tax=Hypsizygus marmoreus TaxID=39966 RepID=A0A369JZS4_HYPMA|nr:hypothetical protein Hypma_002303 [Hypsizygus marmoreus]
MPPSSSSPNFTTHSPQSSPVTSPEMARPSIFNTHNPGPKPLQQLPSGTEKLLLPQHAHAHVMKIAPRVADLFRANLPYAVYTITTSLEIRSFFLTHNVAVEQVNITIYKPTRRRLPKVLSDGLTTSTPSWLTCIAIPGATYAELASVAVAWGTNSLTNTTASDGAHEDGSESPRDGEKRIGEGTEHSELPTELVSEKICMASGQGGGGGGGNGGDGGGGDSSTYAGKAHENDGPGVFYLSTVNLDLVGCGKQSLNLSQRTTVEIYNGYVPVAVKSCKVGTTADSDISGRYDLATVKISIFPCDTDSVLTDEVNPAQQPSFLPESVLQAGANTTLGAMFGFGNDVSANVRGPEVTLSDEDDDGQSWTYSITDPNSRTNGLILKNAGAARAPSLRFCYMCQLPPYLLVKTTCTWETKRSTTIPTAPCPGYENIIHEVEVKIPLDVTNPFSATGDVRLDYCPATVPDRYLRLHDTKGGDGPSSSGQSTVFPPRESRRQERTGIYQEIPEFWFGRPSRQPTIFDKVFDCLDLAFVKPFILAMVVFVLSLLLSFF